MFIHRIKAKLRDWLFAEHTAKLIALTERAERLNEEMLAERKSLTINDLVRSQLKGFNPRLLDRIENTESADILSELKEDGEGEETFLRDIHEVKKNKSFERLVTYLIRNQIIFSAKEAQNLRVINFGRATINGLSLVREEIAYLSNIYTERSKAPETFDKHDVI